MQFTVDCTGDGRPLKHFWQSTGFSPAELLLTPDMRQCIAYVGSIPYGGITQVRIHYLLELVQVSPVAGEQPRYDWTLLDAALDVLVKNNLKPFFELMGNPGSQFTDFNDDSQLRRWRDLVRDTALHLIARYGRDTVNSWYFESWNEPDAPWWPQWPADIRSFCNYYDACLEGLRLADPALVLGGPGTCRTLSDLFRGFLAHCDTGTNYFTGHRGVRLDFISIHEKGVRANKEDLNPRTGELWRREAEVIRYIRANHPRLASLPFMNNECDPQVGWGDVHTWHARPYYAAIACKIINQHLLGLADGLGVDYALLSNDNGFLGRWGNRTLLARFGAPVVFDDGQLHHKPKLGDLAGRQDFPPFELIKKPILNMMAMLALLGDQRCAGDRVGDPDSDVGVIATRRGNEQVAVLVYHSRDQIMSSGSEQVTLRLRNLPFAEAAVVHYRIDAEHGDPYTLWEAAGAPDLPSPELYASMRRNQELTAGEPELVTISGGQMDVVFDLPLPSVSLVLLTERPPEAPGAIERVWCEPYDGLTGGREVLVCWQGLASRGIRTYEVLAAKTADGPFRRVNDADLICTAYLDVFDRGEPRFYQVRATDYWGRTGEPSPVVASGCA